MDFRVIGYIPLHYGAEYLAYAIRSMEPVVEKIMVIYTPKPSQGFNTNVPCPETEAELFAIAQAASPKVEWHKAEFSEESKHREYILQFTAGYDLVFTLDADEVVEPADIGHALKLAYESDKRWIGINGFINFWRSFSYVNRDGFIPYRIINLRNGGGYGVVDCRIYHFSTAQNADIIRYKWEVSGHKNEVRHRWMEDIYLAWRPGCDIRNLHPVALNIWGEAQPFDKSTLPDILKEHPNFNKELI